MIKILETASYSHPKIVDRINQDSILPPIPMYEGFLFAIADGVGSYKGGEFASQTAVKHLLTTNDKYSITTGLRDTFENIRTAVKKLSIINSDFSRAATTLTVGYIDQDNLYIGHVGDCRLYIKSGNRLKQITKDHTQLQEFVDEKLYTKKYLQTKNVKNILTSAIASNVDMKVDLLVIPVSEIQDENCTISIYLMSDGTHKFWDRRPRFSNKTLNSISKFASSLKVRTEKFTPVDDYSFVGLSIFVSKNKLA